MSASPYSSVGQLLYASAPDLCFARMVSDLDGALESAIAAPRRLAWDHEDVALVDYDGTRITLGFSREVPGRWGACLTVAVGSGPGGGEPLAPERQARLARMIAERITRRHPPDEIRWHELPAVMTAELADALISAVADRDEPAAVRARPDPFPPVDDRLVDAADARAQDALASRADAYGYGKRRKEARVRAAPVRRAAAEARGQAATRSAPAPAAAHEPGQRRKEGRGRIMSLRRAAPGPAPVPRRVLGTTWRTASGATWSPAESSARTPPATPPARAGEAARLRAALYEPDPGPESAPGSGPGARPGPAGDSLQIRLAAHVMNATIMTISLPIGASVMTYSLLRGGNLRSSARVMALVGITIGLTQGLYGISVPGLL